MNRLTSNRVTYLIVGLAIGLVTGLNLQGLWPSVPLHGLATHGQENFAIATGFVDDGIEALYFLDFLTGDMKAAVIQLRTGNMQGKFNSFYSYNIAQDFGGLQTKNPKYLMVTGQAQLPRGRANFQFADSILYVAEATTGKVACYTIPWNSSQFAQGRTQTGTFYKLDEKVFRDPVIREAGE